jgi:uncharacterized membrane protein YfcA
MSLDLYVTLTGLAVGFIVGMTGMGGGALMTPALVMLFKVQPLAAVSSDLVASMIMKPVGSAVHWRRGTVKKELVAWLMVGSVPAAFLGVLVIRLLGRGYHLQHRLTVTLGVVLVLAAVTIVLKGYLEFRRRQSERAHRGPLPPAVLFRVKPVPTVIVGLIGGLVVGMTSVGSGSLIIAALMLLYPALTSKELVGTDLVQAIPLVTAAAIGHILFGDFQLGLTVSILLGSIPGVYLGARLSAVSPDWLVRPALILVLLTTGLKLANVANSELGIVMLVALLLCIAFGAVIANSAARRPQLAAAAVADSQPGSGGR